MAFKKKSELVEISDRLITTDGNTFTQAEVSLPLDTLSQEIFVVTDIVLDADLPNHAPGLASSVSASVCSTSQSGVQDISNSRCMSSVRTQFLSITAEGNYFQVRQPEAIGTTGTTRDFIGIVATPNFFVQIGGNNNTSAKAVNFRLTGYRAVADTGTYSALVASEVLSN
jgi:hypothetical protein